MSYSDLPRLSPDDYVKHECAPNCRCPASNLHRSIEHEPDIRLLNWEEWMRKRKSICQKISKEIKRNTEEILQNSFEDYREDQEMRMVMQYSKIPFPHDKYRGNPSFWTFPAELKKKNLEDPPYFATRSKIEKQEIPQIEYIGVPDVIKTEKESTSIRKSNWKTIPYVINKMQQESVLRIQPHKPDLRDLVIIGKAVDVGHEEEKYFVEVQQSLPNFTPPSTPSYDILILNNIEIQSTTKGTIEIYIIFTDVELSKPKLSKLEINNPSQTCIKFYFISENQSVTENQGFYYNKNLHIIQPQDKLEFPFWFKSNKYGPYKENLRMIIIPDFWNEELTIMIKLTTNVSRSYDLAIQRIIKRLENQIRSRVIKETLEDMVKAVPSELPKLNVYTYDRATIFEAVNSIYDPQCFRPKYLYDKDVVDKLEDFYNRIRLDKHPDIWDYKIETLRVIVKDRENKDKADELEKKLEELVVKVDEAKLQRQILDELALQYKLAEPKVQKQEEKGKDKLNKSEKPSPLPSKVQQGKEDPKKKIEASTLFYKDSVREIYPKTLQDELEEILAKLKEPIFFKIEHERRLRLCYNLFCAYIDRICEEVGVFEEKYKINNPMTKKVNVPQIDKKRFVDEVKYGCSIETKAFKEIRRSLPCSKAPEWTREIPLEDYEERFKAFTASNEVLKDKGGKSKVPPKISLTKVIEESKIIEAGELDSTISVESAFIPEHVAEHYYNNTYIIFYHNLSCLIDDMVAIFELNSKPVIPQKVMQKLQEHQFDSLSVDQNLNVKIFDLKRVISDVLKWKESGTAYLQREMVILPKFKPDIAESSSSVWNILRAYVPKKEPTRPKTDGEIYGLFPPPYPPDTDDAATTITPESVILERNIQTSLTDSEPIVDIDLVREPSHVCTCDEPLSLSEDSMLYYNSQCSDTTKGSTEKSNTQ